MRMIAPPPQVRELLRFPQKQSEWPLVLRFCVLVIPVGMLVALVSLWVGHKASSATLMHAIEAIPMLEAREQAGMMGDFLSDMRKTLSRIAKSGLLDEGAIRDGLNARFHESIDLVQEITIMREDGTGYMLLRDNGEFVSLSISDASTGPNSPLQQITTSPLHRDRATLYPPVFFGDVTSPRHSHERRTPVMRMAMPIDDGSGAIILGINFAQLRHHLAAVIRSGSSFRLPQQEGAVQLAFYFDVRGWVLFEMDSSTGDVYLPDVSRQGYTGDLGRAGYEAAFRPAATHENFWRMVTEVAAGRSGSIPSPANKYTATHVGASGALCFTPVWFSPADGLPAQPIGGIAFFETSTLPLATFLRLANYSLIIVAGALLVFAMLSWRLYKTVVCPFRRMSQELENLSRASVPDFVKSSAGCQEQEQLKSAMNRIIANAMRTHSDLDYLSREIHQSRSHQPVDLSLVVPERDPAENDYDLLGSSPLIRKVRDHVRKAAQAGTDVLIWGETGTGKELVAEAIHKASSRAGGAYISINCGALDESLLLDTLFGHVKGAFTEAKTDRKGAFLAADGGTLHLDEIANASLRVQQALLRALSVRRIRILGTDEETPFDTRIVAATNVDLRESVRAGTFREDLYYRLAIISIETPPLRHRKEDIPELAAFFIDDAAKALGRPAARLSHGALDLMAAHDWPGNVREFKNCLTRAMAFVEGDLILRQHITLERDAFRAHARPVSSNVPPAKQLPTDPAVRPPVPPSAADQEKGPENLPHDGEAKRGTRTNGFSSIPPKEEGGAPTPLPESLHQITSSGNDKNKRHVRRMVRKDSGKAENEKSVCKDESSAMEETAFTPLELSERQWRAVNFIREHGELSRAQYQHLAGIGFSSRTVQNDLRELVDRGILTRIGAGPGVRYRIRE